MRPPLRAIAIAAALGAALGCGGAGAPARPALTGTAPSGVTCGTGVERTVDLDGDGRADRVILAPHADAVTCLEVVATTAPPLVCRAEAPPELAVIEFDVDGIAAAGTTPCDPSGAAVSVWPSAEVDRPPRVPASAAPAIPTGQALVLVGGDAAAVLAWQGERWAWVPLGY